MAAGASYELINRTVIFALIEAAQRHDHKTLRSMGIDPGSVGQLRNLNLDTVIGSRLSHSLVDIQINQRGLELLFHNSSNKVYREGLIDDAIALGLRHSMLARLVKISRREYGDRLQTQCIDSHPSGRVTKLRENEELRVLETFHELTGGAPRDNWNILELLVKTGRVTGFSLDQVWTVLADNGDLP